MTEVTEVKTERIFELPNEEKGRVFAEGAVKLLVEAIPEAWYSIDGWLAATEELIRSGDVMQKTGYRLDRYCSATPMPRRTGPGEKPILFLDTLELVTGGKLPYSVEFDRVGHYGRQGSFARGKIIATRLIEKGYRGHLMFCRNTYDGNQYHASAQCEVCFVPLSAGPPLRLQSGEKRPACIKLWWDNQFGGKEEVFEGILNLCRVLNLEEIILEQATKVVA